MKESEVPQYKDDFKNRDKINKVLYATDDEGNFVARQSIGWDVEIEATKLAWTEVDEAIEKVRIRVLNGELSPIAYYMELRIMNLNLLAKYVGKWQWQVKRHLKPSVFARLKPAVLNKYTEVFQISMEALLDINKFKKIG